MDISDIILDLSPDPADISGTASRLFEHIEREPAEPERREVIETYFREISRTVLDWMAASDESILREMQGQILHILRELPASHPANRYLGDDEWLGVRLRGLATMISTYLSTANLGRTIGALTGQRYQSWLQAIEMMGENPRRPIRMAMLVDAKIFRHETTASHALNRLVEHGLVTKHVLEGAVTFSLTWAGESFARLLIDRRDPVQAKTDHAPAPAVPAARRTSITAGELARYLEPAA